LNELKLQPIAFIFAIFFILCCIIVDYFDCVIRACEPWESGWIKLMFYEFVTLVDIQF